MRLSPGYAWHRLGVFSHCRCNINFRFHSVSPKFVKKTESTMQRVERDSLGEILIDQGKLWGPQTQRSLKYFNICAQEKMPLHLIHAMAMVKYASAHVNMTSGKLEKNIGEAILTASKEVIDGVHDDQFPLVVWQTGSGTHTNMNVNEVIANRALQLLDQPLGSKNTIHPNDHVNMAQSSNDTFPTAMHISAAIQIQSHLLPQLRYLAAAFQQCIMCFGSVMKIGRTHLQDATPLTLGQEFGAFLTIVENGIRRIQAVMPCILQLAQGGTAVGTGLNAFEGFAENVAEKISHMTNLPFRTASNKFEALSSIGALTELSAALSTTAADFLKIANDIRLLASGPRCGFSDILIPANEPGSSIMPGKVNPTQCEALSMACAEIIGNHTTVTLSSSHGHLQLNVFRPVVIYNILRSIQLLAEASHSFAEHCIFGIVPNNVQLEQHVKNSLMLVTCLSKVIGYDACAEIAKYAHHNNLSLRDAALQLKLVSPETFDSLVKPEKMISPQ